MARVPVHLTGVIPGERVFLVGTNGQALLRPKHRHHRHLSSTRQPGPGRAAEFAGARLQRRRLPGGPERR